MNQSTTEKPWIHVDEQLPPLDKVVMTKIDDARGVRNEHKLKAFQRNAECRVMWFLADDSMYVYYTPTHWRDV